MAESDGTITCKKERHRGGSNSREHVRLSEPKDVHVDHERALMPLRYSGVSWAGRNGTLSPIAGSAGCYNDHEK